MGRGRTRLAVIAAALGACCRVRPRLLAFADSCCVNGSGSLPCNLDQRLAPTIALASCECVSRALLPFVRGCAFGFRFAVNGSSAFLLMWWRGLVCRLHSATCVPTTFPYIGGKEKGEAPRQAPPLGISQKPNCASASLVWSSRPLYLARSSLVLAASMASVRLTARA